MASVEVNEESTSFFANGDECASRGDWDLILDNKVDPSTLSATALHRAAKNQRYDVVWELVKFYGLDINSPDFMGWTVLHTAITQGNEINCFCLSTLGARDSVTKDGVRASMLRPELWNRVVDRQQAMFAGASGTTEVETEKEKEKETVKVEKVKVENGDEE